jgi:hypothetical protein
VNLTESVTADVCREWLETLQNVVQEQRGPAQEW